MSDARCRGSVLTFGLVFQTFNSTQHILCTINEVSLNGLITLNNLVQVTLNVFFILWSAVQTLALTHTVPSH